MAAAFTGGEVSRPMRDRLQMVAAGARAKAAVGAGSEEKWRGGEARTMPRLPVARCRHARHSRLCESAPRPYA